MLPSRCLLPAALVMLAGSAAIHAADATPAPAGPAYQIVLRSRNAEATPTRSRDAQTGGGSIVVEQPDPNTIIVTMGGSAVAGSECRGGNAGIDFNLDQELEIIPTRVGARPPRIGLVGRVVGTLQVTDPGKCGKACGSSQQGPAMACLAIGDTSLLSLSVKHSAVSAGQEVSLNHREGPFEARASVGTYHLTGTFHIDVSQGKGVWNRQAAVADFDPAPQLDGFWADVLKPFQAVPRRDFGFKIVLRVVEDTAAPDADAPK